MVVQVLRWRRLILLHEKRVRRTAKVKLRPPLCRPLKHSMIEGGYRTSTSHVLIKGESLAKDNLQKSNTNKYYYKIWGSQFAMLLWGSRLHGFVLRGFSARIFCTDFLHGFSARIFCTDFLHGFSARISARSFCTFFARFFCADVCTDCLQELFVPMLHGFLHGFFGVSQNTCWKAPKFHRENPPKNSPCFGGLLGRGSGGRRVR